MATSKLSIWNMALDRVNAPQVASPDEDSLAAAACRRWWPHIVSSVLEGPHDWSFANRRVTLAAVANSRDSEWLYAYQLPSGVGSPIRIIPNFEGLGLSIPVPIDGGSDPYAERWAGLGEFELPYIIEDGVLYTNTDEAQLEYVIGDIDEGVIGAKLAEALALQLAAWLATALKKDHKLRAEILGEAEVALERAMADDQNRHPRSSGGYTSETLRARRA